jgi:hypothetical protein
MSAFRSAASTLATFALASISFATKVAEVQVIDDSHLMIRFQDAWVHHDEDPKDAKAMMGHESIAKDRIEIFGDPLDLVRAVEKGSYSLQSSNDPRYALPTDPLKVFRKTKVSGTAWKWPDPDLTYEHSIFLQLPQPLMQGKTYRLLLNPALNADKPVATFTRNFYSQLSDALHVNMIGYNSGQSAMKSADLYMWMGDGGARDYASYIGKKVFLVPSVGKPSEVGKVTFWKKAGQDYGKWNLTRSDVWNCDFSNFNKVGTYRLAVEGVGASLPFEIQPNAYFEPFKTSVRGFYYMRIGEPLGLTPPPRQPQFIPGKNPPDFTVYLTNYSPWHPDWKKARGDQWDVKDYSKYLLPGKPTNPNAYGGHSDALDWDRHCGHISIIWDLLLAYVMTNGKGGEDNLGIRESGNGIPDVIDEAQNEVDFWLRLRDQNGDFATGLNNPTDDLKTMYQGGSRPYMAWANAANSAMLALAFRIANKPEMVRKYTDAAIEAWKRAKDEDLDEKHSIGNGVTRGRDLRQLAAACLYVITGEKSYEELVLSDSVIKTSTDVTEQVDQYNQMYGTAVYLATGLYKWRIVADSKRYETFSNAIRSEAIPKHVDPSESRPSRRSADEAFGWFQSIQETQKAIVAHTVTNDRTLRNRLLKALILEADWGLGRNPMNMTQMTGIGERTPDQIYTSGRNDGVPGVHPGHTPYMNSENWGTGFMADPRYYASRGYPAWEQWPHGEALWRAPYCFSNNEFTPQQSMRGKHALYAYLHAIGK